MRFHTVKQGEEAIVFNVQGEGRHIVGPERVFLFRERLEKLRHVRASQYQYLVVKDKREGIVTHRIGPCEMFHNPLDHEHISVEDAIKIDANHLIVVYRRVKDSVERSVVQGPAIFFPEADEWLHKFEWHGADPVKKERMVPGIRKFTQLAAIPDQFYYNVRDVRTTDDIIITVKLMIFFQINDVNVMLDTTHDPVADMINAVCADVIAYVGRLKYEEFLEQTESLSELSTYPHLQQRTQRVGFDIHKVVYRGYEATEQLQRMQTEAIEARTRLRLDAEIEDQKQKLVDYKLQTEQDRTKMRQQMERSKLEHRQTLDRLTQEHQSEMLAAEHTHRLAMDQVHTTATLDILAEDQAQREGTLGSLRELGVDLTQYLVSQQPPAVSQELQLVTQHTGNTVI